MKKRFLIGAVICSLVLSAQSVLPVMADAVKVVTLGADLSDADKQKMLRYFKVDNNQVQIISITNADEKAHLGKYFSAGDIGSRTVSCAYVKPTTSGGIKVRTANLNKVTCNMIASILSTSGVKNCEVVAACPFEVSGTGALTGVMMAYETASGENLDQTKKEIATEELKITGDLADELGQDDATSVVNQAKMEVVGNDIHNGDEIYNVVINVSQQVGVDLTDEQVDAIASLMEDIAEQDYDYQDMRETLETVEENTSGAPIVEDDEELIEVEEDPDSILSNLDETVLGDDVIAGSTEDPSLAEKTSTAIEGDEWDVVFDDDQEEDEELSSVENTEEGIEMVYDEQNQSDPDLDTFDLDEIDQDETDLDETGLDAAKADEDDLNTDELDETKQGLFDHAETFARGEYQGDAVSLQFEMGSEADTSVTLEEETGKKLTHEVLKIYLDLLKKGTDSYEWAETDIYQTTELNMIDQQLRKLFGIEDAKWEGEDILAEVSQEDKDTLYKETMEFFKKLYHETDSDEMLDDYPEDEEDLEEITEELNEDEESYE